MKLGTIRALRGPNVWTRRTAIEAVVELSEKTLALPDIPGFEARLRERLPALDLSCAQGKPGPETLAHVLERVALALQIQAGCAVSFSHTAQYGPAGQFKVVVEYGEEAVGRLALETAQQLLDAVLNDVAFDFGSAIRQLRSLDEQIRLGPSTGSIVKAAQRRGIPVRRLTEGSLVQLGWGSRQRRILAAETDRTSAIAESIAQDKELTKTLLRSVGVPVPEGRPVDDAEDAWKAACEVGLPVVIKPQYGNQGRGVAVNLGTHEQVVAAYEAAKKEGDSIVVEKFAPGCDHRLLIIGGKLVAAARREPPKVIGDGVHTVEQLVERENLDPRRGEDHATCLSKMRLDDIGLAVLAEQGYTKSSVPPVSTVVYLRRNANLSTGGSAIDVTDEVHPEVVARAIDAARVVGLDIAGVDVVCTDVRRPLEEQRAVVVEVNAAPGFRMHLEPSHGTPRGVGEAVVSTMFADGDNGRIPVVAVAGTNGKTTTTRLIAHLFKSWGRRVGMTCTDGVYVAGKRIDTGDCSGPKSARSVLLNPMVDAAVLETARGGVLREGLGFDRCDVAVVTNLGGGDHLGINGIQTVDQLAAVKRVIVENVSPSGYAVLNAADALTADMVSYCPGSAIFFAREGNRQLLGARRAQGGRVVFVEKGAIVAAEGQREWRVAELADVPLTMGGRVGFQVDNALAAVGAAWAAGIPFDVMRAGLASFVSDVQAAPGRFNVLRHGSATIIADYGHNPDALLALVDAVAAMPHTRRLAVFSCAGDRRDIDIVRQAEILGASFDTVFLYEDACNRGRVDGEVLALMRRGMKDAARARDIREVRGEFVAIEAALRALKPGDIALVQVDQIEPSLAFIQQLLPKLPPLPAAEPAAEGARARRLLRLA